MSLSRTPLSMVTDDGMKQCKEQGGCCKCGACCITLSIPNMPQRGDGGSSTIRMYRNRPVYSDKLSGDPCPHLTADTAGGLICGIYDSPYKPRACGGWNGNGNDGKNYPMLEWFMRQDMLTPDHRNKLPGIRLMCRTNAAALLRRRLGDAPDAPLTILTAADDVIDIVRTYLQDLGVVDDEIFDYIGLQPYLHHLRANEPAPLVRIMDSVRSRLKRRNAVHAEFVTANFKPEERVFIWGKA